MCLAKRGPSGIISLPGVDSACSQQQLRHQKEEGALIPEDCLHVMHNKYVYFYMKRLWTCLAYLDESLQRDCSESNCSFRAIWLLRVHHLREGTISMVFSSSKATTQYRPCSQTHDVHALTPADGGKAETRAKGFGHICAVLRLPESILKAITDSNGNAEWAASRERLRPIAAKETAIYRLTVTSKLVSYAGLVTHRVEPPVCYMLRRECPLSFRLSQCHVSNRWPVGSAWGRLLHSQSDVAAPRGSA